VENLLLLVPLLLSCWANLSLHSVLESLPEEFTCLTASRLLLGSPLLIALLAALQYWLFLQYNLAGHPWSLVLASRRLLRVRVRLAGSEAWPTVSVEAALLDAWPGLVSGARAAPTTSYGYTEEGLGQVDGAEWVVELATAPENAFQQLKKEVGEVKLLELLGEKLVSGPEEEQVVVKSCPL
jgi:hypothetical protein